jgi:hypothetical protein
MKGTAMYETRRALVVGLALALTLVTTAAPAASSPAAQAPQSQADAQFSDYHFRDGLTLADLRLHYATLGTPHHDAQGSIDNAVLFLHWTGASSQELLTPEYRSALFGHGAPFEPPATSLSYPMRSATGNQASLATARGHHFRGMATATSSTCSRDSSPRLSALPASTRSSACRWAV